MNTKNTATIIKTPAGAGISVVNDDHRLELERIIAKRSFCTMATTSPAGLPHNAGVVYQAVDGKLWIHSMRSGRKVRNLVASPKAAVCVPFRRLPVGPPFTISFQAHADVLDMTNSRVIALVAAGRLNRLTGHGELDMPDGCFVVITPVRALHSFGPGASVTDLIRDPINTGGRSVRLGDAVESAEGQRR